MRILIATGIYPPDIGGPAQYAKNLFEEFKKDGHKVTVKHYGKIERLLPAGLRHIYFMLKTLPSFISAKKIIVLDTWSVALPVSILSTVFKKKFVIRTGGDFLWESYVERTKKKVLFKDFYITELNNFSPKEKFIFNKTKWILKVAHRVVFSTNWQRNIWVKSYGTALEKTTVVDNYIGERISSESPLHKIFVGATRDLIWKNIDVLKKVFIDRSVIDSGARLDLDKASYDEFLEKVRSSYAVILVSLGDISPNMILDAIRYGKPFICTKECGLYDELKDVGIWVDPLDEDEIKEKVIWLSKDSNYQDQCVKVSSYKKQFSWKDVADGLINLD